MRSRCLQKRRGPADFQCRLAHAVSGYLFVVLIDASLVSSVEDVIRPGVVVASGVVIHQVRSTVTLGRVAIELVSGAGEEENSVHAIVAGYVVQKSVVAGAIHRKAMLRVS